MVIDYIMCLFALQKLNIGMNKEKDQEYISSTQKLEEVIRRKKSESNALKKLIISLENFEKEELKNNNIKK